jgi:hypothetical protein
VEYGGKSKGDGEDNARTREWTSFFKASGWMSSTNSLTRPRDAYGRANKLHKEVHMVQIEV